MLNGFGLSEQHWGGFSRFQRVKGEWLVRLPGTFSPLQAMAIGTAGHHITASTGRADAHDYLRGLGASEFIDRAALQGQVRPLQRETWAGAVDSVGSVTLANVLAQMEYGLARDLPAETLSSMTTITPMSKLPQWAEAILAGRVRGRVVIDVTR